MRIQLFLVPLLAMFGCRAALAVQQVPAALVFTPEQAMPVEVYRGDTRTLRFEVRNTSSRTISVSKVFPRKGKGGGTVEPGSLAPGAKGLVTIEATFPEALGEGQVNYLVKTDNPDKETELLEVNYFVQSAYEPDLMLLDLGDIHPGQRVRSTLEVETRLAPELRFDKVLSKPDWLNVEVKPSAGGSDQSRMVVATTTGQPPIGLNTTEIVLESNLASDRVLHIPVVVRSFSKYGISPFPLTFGGVPEGQDKERTLRVRKFDGGKVQIKHIETGSPALRVKQVECGKACVDLKLDFDSMKARGGLRIALTISFVDDDVSLAVPIDALVVPIGVKSIELGGTAGGVIT